MVVGEFSLPSVLEQMSSALSLPSVLPKAPGMRARAELTKGGSPELRLQRHDSSVY